jgi:hypothetical protein
LARIAVFVPDLMLGSRVNESLRAAGHEVVNAGAAAVPDSLGGAAAAVCDLDAVDPSDAAGLGVPVVAFSSHVDVETRRRALDAGLQTVVPRSRMVRELPDLVGNLL